MKTLNTQAREILADIETAAKLEEEFTPEQRVAAKEITRAKEGVKSGTIKSITELSKGNIRSLKDFLLGNKQEEIDPEGKPDSFEVAANKLFDKGVEQKLPLGETLIATGLVAANDGSMVQEKQVGNA